MDVQRIPIRLFFLVCLTAGQFSALSPAQETSEEFEKTIAPLLAARCVECHHAKNHEGGLDLTRYEAVLRGGDSGEALRPGNPRESLIYQRVAAGEMPPPERGQSQSLGAEDVEKIGEWIRHGAPWSAGRVLGMYESTSTKRAGRDWWSLKRIERPAVPEATDPLASHHVATNPIDAFIRDQLHRAPEFAGMEVIPAPRASRRVLIRRASIDLLGLPPTADAIEAFENDRDPAAWERLIDSMLASPHYGERWGRYWLDVVRFAETCGYERDQLKPEIWRYRDWVVDALNDDLPYDRFLTYQLAGDEVPDRSEETVTATGMLRAGTWNDEPNDAADYLYERLEDVVHTTSTAFMGLTVKCARCHDHKFDPVPQEDYYRLASFFWAGYLGQENLGGPNHDQLGFERFGWTDRGPNPDPIRLLIKGERHSPGPEVEPGFLSAVPWLDQPLQPPEPGSKTTGRRLQYARWLSDTNHPLTARVIVNRIWQHHFGEGLVRTPDDFGFNGAPPTHPALLDWLAAELMHPTIAPGEPWTLKRLHKLIMLSGTYQQSSTHPQEREYASKDSQNRLLWRFNRQRLDAEALRDALLVASGELNIKRGGPSFFPEVSAEALEGLSRKDDAWGHSPPSERARRSLYMMSKRSRLLPLMTAFDMCDTTSPCGRREVTTVAPQALALMNNAFVHAQSRGLATRVQRLAPEGVNEQVQLAWKLALGRLPTADELHASLEHLDAQRTHFASLAQDESDTIERTANDLQVRQKLSLWLRADRGVDLDDHRRVRFWKDGSQTEGVYPHDAMQGDANARPTWVERGWNDRPIVRFNGQNQFLRLAGQPMHAKAWTIFAVVTNQATDGGAREIVSNWDRHGRSTTSLFLGTIGKKVRFSDALATQSELQSADQPFILTAINGEHESRIFQNRHSMASASSLPNRDLTGEYVLGTQGNYGFEWWHGDMAEVLIFDRELAEDERVSVWRYLEDRHGIQAPEELHSVRLTPEQLALASLCHVLLNTNEFIYVD